MNETILHKQIRNRVLFLILAISLSGITAFPLESELKWLDSISGIFPLFLTNWIHLVYSGLKVTNDTYPFMSYGTDWLAFAHLIIAFLFIGPFRNPIKNSWVIEWAILCCCLSFPTSFIAGAFREIPFFHQLIDCSFGVIGLIPLIQIRKKIRQLELIEAEKS